MRRTSSFLTLLLLTAISVGLLASCTENKPAGSTSTSSSGTVKLIPSNMTEGGEDLTGGGGATGGQSPSTVTHVYNPAEQYNQSIGAGGASTPSRVNDPVAQQRPAAKPPVDNAELPDAPAGAQWTLYCQTISGPGHVERSNDVKRQLVQATGMKSWYVIHAADASNLYYGFYRTIDPSDRSDSRKEGQQAQTDRKRIDGMKDAQGDRPFARCMFVELSAPDPQAPPEWDLRNTPEDMFWSVQIAAYQGHPDRKKFAVDAVRDARAHGIPAYYFHGASVSSVCVGAWPLNAVRYDLSRGQTNDPGKSIIVLPEGLPKIQGNLKDQEGRPLQAVRSEVEIVDPSLIQTLQKYPTHAINGTERVVKGKDRNGNPTERPEPSFMVRIPNRYVQGERRGDLVNPDRPETDPGAGYSWLRPQNRDRRLDYIPTQKSGGGRSSAN